MAHLLAGGAYIAKAATYAPPARTGKVCFDLYLAEAVECEEKHINSVDYEACMKIADLKYERCMQGLPPIPSR